MKSEIRLKNGSPFIFADNELHYPLAYTAYFEECGRFSDFIKSNYRMFFVNVSFTDLPINNVTGFSPFRTGVFEGETPDYSEFDGTVREILAECPGAMIFPRINVAMPRKWLEANSYETVETGWGRRESLCSEVYFRDGAELLKKLVSHIRLSDYAHRVAGYQVCGGTTQEWMHHDLQGSFSEMGVEKFRNWAEERYEKINVKISSSDDLERENLMGKYGEFCSETAAKAVEHFAKTLKEYINGEQIVGAFYGYNAFVNDYLFGLHGLRFIIDSPYIDFFSSPCGYDDSRRLGIDWGDMLPTESVKNHGKLYFVECDIRTCLTKRMQDSRPGKYPDGIYTLENEQGNKTVWAGPETVELSLSAIQKAFAHQLTKSSGIWWFDMWGGWYRDEKIMSEMKKLRDIAESVKEKEADLYPASQTVVFIDEKAYLNNPRGSDFCHCVNWMRMAMGNTGIPYEFCMVEDAEKVLHKYKAAIFTAPLPSENGEKAVQICRKFNVPYLQTDKEKLFFSTEELREFLVSNGVHCYNENGNVVYCGNGFIGIHSAYEGEIKIKLPQKYKVKPLTGTDLDECETDEISICMKKHHTAVFELV